MVHQEYLNSQTKTVDPRDGMLNNMEMRIRIVTVGRFPVS